MSLDDFTIILAFFGKVFRLLMLIFCVAGVLFLYFALHHLAGILRQTAADLRRFKQSFSRVNFEMVDMRPSEESSV